MHELTTVILDESCLRKLKRGCGGRGVEEGGGGGEMAGNGVGQLRLSQGVGWRGVVAVERDLRSCGWRDCYSEPAGTRGEGRSSICIRMTFLASQ